MQKEVFVVKRFKEQKKIMAIVLLKLQRRFPDFSYINRDGDLNGHIDCVIIR